MGLFAVLVLIVASNVVAVRYSNQELAPFWGAAARFTGAGLLFAAYVAVRRLPLLRGRALAGAILFGLFQFGLGFALAYWALLEVPAGLGSVILATIPLFTLLFAVMLRLERLTFWGVAGGLAALAGIAVLYGERAGTSIVAARLLAMVGAAACFALGPVIAKAFGATSPAPSNAIGMLVGAALLISLSLVTGEPRTWPHSIPVWTAFIYLIGPGSVGLFMLLLFMLGRWPASVVAFSTPMSPIVAIGLSAILLGEPLTAGLIAGTLLVMLGVVLGTIAPSRIAARRVRRATGRGG
jgi:drug/metabolite transporter (DMT)-like permease